MKHQYILTVDIGTSSTKTVLWTENGKQVAEASESYSLIRQHPSWAEMNAIDWWKATCTTVRKVITSAGADARQVVGIGVDGLGWTLLPVDSQGEPLRPAMIWLDRRAEEEAAWLRSLPEASRLVDLVANPLDAAYITPKLIWLRKHEPETFEKTYKFLTSSGFIVARMTGSFTCDYTQAYGYHFFDIRQEQWDPQAAALAGVPLEKMPTLYPPTAVVGELNSIAANMTGLVEGIPVIAGGLDACVGALGAGAVRLGRAVDQGGQAGGMALHVDQVIVEPRLIFSHHILPGKYLFQSGTVGGGTPSWFRNTLGQAEVNAADLLHCSPFQLMSQQVEASSPGAHGLIFLPYMAGERTPLWSSSARGVFFGLSYKTTRADILRAIMEGCAFAVYHNLLIAEQKGACVKEWIGIGGAAQSSAWCQIKADVSNRPFVVARLKNGKEGGHNLGLYAMVAHAIGIINDIPGTIENLLPKRKVYEPSQSRHEMYSDLFQVYSHLSEKLLSDFDALAAVTDKHQTYLHYQES